MFNRKILFPLFLYTVFSSSFALAEELEFHPVAGVDAIVTEVNGKISYRIRDKQGVVEKNIDIGIVDTDTRLHIQTDDYLFNGTEGFSVMYLDEGKGTYDVYHIFTYSMKSRDFIERFPVCGDNFLNLDVNKNKKYLKSTYYSDNEPRVCVTRLKPD